MNVPGVTLRGDGAPAPSSPQLSEAELRSMTRLELRNYIFDLECDPALGYGHLGGMHERSKENLIAVAMLYQQIAREFEAARNASPQGNSGNTPDQDQRP